MSGKLHYICFRGRAKGELPRLVCAAAGIEFTDERIAIPDWAAKYKNNTPFGQIPVLDVDGKRYAQKLAMSLYLARLGGLYPTSASPLELLKLEHALLFTEEILETYVNARGDKHFRNKPETLPQVVADVFPVKLPLLEKLLKENGTGYYFGDKLSIVDLSAFDVIEHVLDEVDKDYLNTYPLIKTHFEKVSQVKGIKEYLATRPKSIF